MKQDDRLLDELIKAGVIAKAESVDRDTSQNIPEILCKAYSSQWKAFAEVLKKVNQMWKDTQ